ncbi:MAG: twin-arginine translocase subunit TatC [Pseudomonadota bacterium]
MAVQDPANIEGESLDDSQAPLMEHLIELRQRLIYALVAFGVMFVGCFAYAQEIYNVLVLPYVWASGEQQVKLIATHFLEQLYTHIKLSMFGAAFLSFPVIAAQLYMFVAPGLYKNERNAFIPYLVATPVFFVLGAAIVYFLAMPILIQLSIGLSLNTADSWAVTELLPKVNEYLSLIMTLIFGFGIVFQLPVVLTLLARAGMIGADTLRKGRPYAIVAITTVCAILTPPDAISLIIMAMPTVLLYEASILAVQRIEKQNAARDAAENG